MGMALAAQAQSFQVIHSFTGGDDGATPAAGLTVAAAGKFYGTASGAESGGSGLVFKLTSGGSGWVLAPLNHGLPSRGPETRVVIGPNGNLFGASYLGGSGDCVGNGSCGLVYTLQPSPHACASFLCFWNQAVLYRFNNIPDAGVPGSSVVFDSAGNLYGTTEYGGTGDCSNGIDPNYGCGTVYKLTPSGGGWTETVIYSFQGGNDGWTPWGGVIFDAAGNLYGTTWTGGSSSCGTIFELSPSDGGWTKTILHNFQCSDGGGAWGDLIADQSGNLYGATAGGGINNGGVVFELAHLGSWTYNLLYSFPNDSTPAGTLVLDGSGNLYGTTRAGGAYSSGTAYKLTPSNGSWTETDLHDFQSSDGVLPNGGLVFDSAGNLYGTAQTGGVGFDGPCYGIGCGTVWEITP
jgi:uncharacterized repeat protein (TIGR03803 family)